MAKKFRNQAERSSGPTHIHNHEANPAMIIVAKAAIVALGILLLWPVGIFLLSKMGVRQPDQVLASIVVWGSAIVVAYLLLSRPFVDLVDKWMAHGERVEEIKTEQLRYRQLMAGSMATDSRALGEEQRFSALVYAVLLVAYDHQARSGWYKGSWRPWSRRAAGSQILYSLGEREPVGEAMGSKVKSFLEENHIVEDDQLNLDRFPDLASCQRLLYAPPVIRDPNRYMLGAGGKEGRDWSIIDE